MYIKLAAFAATIMFSFLIFGCGPKYPNCDKDGHCNEGEYCVNNLCQQCRDNGDCPEGQACEAGACREIPEYCTQSSDCAEGQICRESRCGPCLSADDCEAGKVCINGICGEAECHSDEECPAGLSCVNYRCESKSEASSDIGSGECEIDTVYFEFDSSEIDSETRKRVEQNYHCLNERGGKVLLEGHCDPRGTTEYNLALGERRARIISKIMRTLGYEPSKMRVVSKGEEEATGNNEAGWAKDRRVEFR